MDDIGDNDNRPLDLQSRPEQQPGIIKQTTSDTLVLVNMESGECYGLNEVGGRLWELCDGSRSVAEIAAVLSDEYEAPEDDVAADVLEILQDLAREKLVVVGER